jgi:hypothetical protein
MDLREELLKAVTERELEGVRVISVEAVKAIVERCDEEQFALSALAVRFGGDAS